MGSPQKQRLVFRVIIWIIILWHVNRQAFGQISFVFLIQGHPVIFRMSHNENLAASLSHSQEHSGFLGLCQNCQRLAVMDIFCRHFCMTGMRCKEYVVKSPYQRNLPVHDFMVKQSENFMVHHPFL